MKFRPETIIIAIISGIIFIMAAIFLLVYPKSVYVPEAQEIEKAAEEVVQQDFT